MKPKLLPTDKIKIYSPLHPAEEQRELQRLLFAVEKSLYLPPASGSMKAKLAALGQFIQPADGEATAIQDLPQITTALVAHEAGIAVGAFAGTLGRMQGIPSLAHLDQRIARIGAEQKSDSLVALIAAALCAGQATGRDPQQMIAAAQKLAAGLANRQLDLTSGADVTAAPQRPTANHAQARPFTPVGRGTQL